MDIRELFRQIGPFPLLTVIIGVLPVMIALAYAARPNEGRLALMRPFSLAALFAAGAGTASGFVYGFAALASRPDLTPAQWGAVYAGLAETFVPAVLGLMSLTVAWLLVAVGMWRGVREV